LADGLGERLSTLELGDAQRAARAVCGAFAAPAAFGLLEIGQDLVPGPPLRSHLAPLVVVARVAAGIHHAVDRRGSAEHPAARRRHDTAVGVWLRVGLIAPFEGRMPA